MPTQLSNNRFLPFGDQRTAPWYGKDILSVKQFSREDLGYVFGVAHEMRGMVERVGTFDLLKGKILANLFYEPSTRTSSSFTAAMERLGGSVIPINEVRYSSVSKGESLPDTVRTLECYTDVIVLPRAPLLEFFDANPAIGYVVTRNLASIVGRTGRMGKKGFAYTFIN